MNTNRRVAVAISGGGRTLANFLEQQKAGVRYEIAAVIASASQCQGNAIAAAAKLPIWVGHFSPALHAENLENMYRWLAEHDIGWLALGGFLKLLPVHPQWHNRIVNIHPALLPDFGGRGMYGDRVHAAVISSGARASGASIHFVNERYDEGSLIAQIRLAVDPHDTPKTLAARVFEAEKKLYPLALQDLLDGKLPLANRGVKIYDA